MYKRIEFWKDCFLASVSHLKFNPQHNNWKRRNESVVFEMCHMYKRIKFWKGCFLASVRHLKFIPLRHVALFEDNLLIYWLPIIVSKIWVFGLVFKMWSVWTVCNLTTQILDTIIGIEELNRLFSTFATCISELNFERIAFWPLLGI
jgi:hypothetical protein